MDENAKLIKKIAEILDKHETRLSLVEDKASSAKWDHKTQVAVLIIMTANLTLQLVLLFLRLLQ